MYRKEMEEPPFVEESYPGLTGGEVLFWWVMTFLTLSATLWLLTPTAHGG